jgi:dienelactone hydrolase
MICCLGFSGRESNPNPGLTMFNSLSSKSIRALAFAIALLFMPRFTPAQITSTSSTPPLADPSDTRFKDVHEDWTTPALTTSHLLPVRPMAGFVDQKAQYTVELLRLQWRWGDPVDVYIMRPKGPKRPPVILYLNGYPSDTDIFRNDDYEDLVTKNGIAAVGFVSGLTGQRYHDRPMKEWFISELQECLATSAHDIQMVLNYLASRGDLDMDRVGMFTQGSGASIAILASAVDPRIKVIEALDPWGDWPTWMATSPFVPKDERDAYVKPDYLKKISTLDPVDYLPKIQAKKFRLDNELFDTVTPKSCREKVRAAAPSGSVIEIYKSMDDFKPAFQDGKNLDWIGEQLRALPNPDPKSGPATTHP